MKQRILLFIPMYNCEKQIVRVLDQIDDEVRKYVTEVLVVDNHSKDNGCEAVKEYIKQNDETNITLVKNKENYSLGGSHKTAIKYAKKNLFDYLIVLHGDDQGNIKDLLPYLQSSEYQKYDCILGSRFMKGSKTQNYSKFRVFGNKVLNFGYSIAAHKRVTDMGSGLNMYRVEIFTDDFHVGVKDNLTFNNMLLLKSCGKKHKIKFIPISWREEDQVSNAKMAKQAFGIIKMCFGYVFAKRRFMNKDHRDNKNFAYDCDILATNNKNKFKIMITGAAGFIGSQLAYNLFREGYNLILIDNFSYGKIDNLIFDDHSFENEVIKMDIRDKEGIEKIIAKGDIIAIYNIAGIAPLPDNQSNPYEAVDVNIGGMVNLLELGRKYGIKKFVQASTNAMYENETVFPTKEDKFNLPTLIYPNAKYCAERFCESFAKTYGMSITCLRFANVYGPHIDCLRKQPPFVGYMIRELYFDRTPTFFSTGNQKRDYIYVDDLIDLSKRVLQSKGFDCVNCCSGKNYSVIEMYNITQKIMGKNIPANFDASEHFWDKYPELFSGVYSINKKILEHEVNKYSLCDNSYAQKKYGWVPKIGIEEGLKNVVDATCIMLGGLEQK